MGKTIKLKNDVIIADDYFYASERIVGKWINNKNLYRQTFGFNNITRGAENTLQWNNSIYPTNSVSNIDEIIHYNAFWHRYTNNNTFNSYQQVPNIHNDSQWNNSIYDLTPNSFTFWVGNMYSTFQCKLLVITIYYTKTTD